LYQADWLMRFYQFSIDEIINPLQPNLELDIDPKLAWALRNLHCFPIDINKAEYRLILRVPGIGIASAVKIVKARKFRQLGWDELRRFGIAVSRAKHFIVCSINGKMPRDIDPIVLRSRILGQSKYAKTITPQQSLFE
jgi:predicted DNA-binding helix-hairpin-helix protein